jgi:hypothetical protein
MVFFPAAHKIRVPAKHADGPVKFQRVRILRGRPPLVLTVLALPLTILLLETSEYWLPDGYKKALQNTRAKVEEEKKKRTSSHHEVSKAGDSADSQITGAIAGEKSALVKRLHPQVAAFVLRLPYIQQQHPVPYQKTDKEWIEATKLMDDPVRLVALKKLIVEETVKGWARDRPTFECIRGISPGKGTKKVESIFDVVVPLHRPPAFLQYVVAWLPDGPRLAKIQLSNTTASRILRIWYPEVYFSAFWNAGKVFTLASYQVARSRIRNLGSRDTSIKPLSSLPNVAVTSPQPPREPSTSTHKSQDAAEKTDDPLLASVFHLAKTLAPETPLAQAKLAFLRTSSALQVQKLQYVPEGAVVFQGYVSLVGSRGKVKSNVSAIYLPAQDQLILPVIIERTEVLPSTTSWHQVVEPRNKRSQPNQMVIDGPTSGIAQLQASVDQRAKLVTQRERTMETVFAAETARIEKLRQQLASEVQKLEEMGGKVSDDAKTQAASKFHYAKKEGPGRVSRVLEALSSTDPHLKKLIEDIASGQPSPASLKEFDTYVDKAKGIIWAQEIEGRRGDQQASKDSSGSLVDMKVTADKKSLGGLKDVASGKVEEEEKATSESIEPSPEGEKGKR